MTKSVEGRKSEIGAWGLESFLFFLYEEVLVPPSYRMVTKVTSVHPCPGHRQEVPQSRDEV